jgi:hypothetical protein
MNAASKPYTTVLLITTSMSYRRYFMMATPAATGISGKKTAKAITGWGMRTAATGKASAARAAA